ncbi:hypothetical protein B0920_02130 [Massilia sp. KIM]|uniref:hypothetical protein n=1 Tax=Massilia sp. KIM TaxID=1955422 RepID=UPI00098E9DA4|nr:hypothetical protein [Massilia sp. KIM]OON62299.1 hypothetical protein B0920_02130 [Massilia sp. KIM]
MEISNNDLARILGRIEANLEAQGKTSARIESAVEALDEKLTGRLDDHDLRLRALEKTDPAGMAQTIAGHEKRLAELEKGAARAGVIAGIGSSAGMAILVELLKKKIGM